MKKYLIAFVFSVISFSTVSYGAVSETLVPSKGDYSKIRDSSLLPPDFEPRVTSSIDLKKDPEFKRLIRGKIHRMPAVFLHYSYSSEGVNDTAWGCAWRGIQTVLSSFYNGDVTLVPPFKELYENYGGREFLEKELELRYDNLPDDEWLAPHEEWHMWGDVLVGQMIAQRLGMKNTLVTLNAKPESFMPKVSDKVTDFPTLKRLIKQHFAHKGFPILIDNGTYALNILGVGEKRDRFFLLIGDPHLNFERDNHPLNGIYIIELDRHGRQVCIQYPAIHNHYDSHSYKTLQFTKNAKWDILFTTN